MLSGYGRSTTLGRGSDTESSNLSFRTDSAVIFVGLPESRKTKDAIPQDTDHYVIELYNRGRHYKRDAEPKNGAHEDDDSQQSLGMMYPYSVSAIQIGEPHRRN